MKLPKITLLEGYLIIRPILVFETGFILYKNNTPPHILLLVMGMVIAGMFASKKVGEAIGAIKIISILKRNGKL